MKRQLRVISLAALLAVLTGCAGVNIDQAVDGTNAAAREFTQGKLELSRTEEQRSARALLSEQLLAKPVTMADAVQLQLANSPSLQALIAQSWADLASANQLGRLANPVFSFERSRFGSELELQRLLSVGVLDLLTLPYRQGIARNQVAQAKTQLSVTVVEQVSQVRQAWVRAVAAKQLLTYAQQINKTAQASAELARRMQQVGNFTKLQRARQQVFYADTAAQLASAQHAETAAREELVRLLGLDDTQAARLQLPDRLPDLPSEPRAAIDIGASTTQQRLDLQMALLQLEAAGRTQGLRLLNTVADVELGVRNDTVFQNDGTGRRDNRKGYDLAIRLPIFDLGAAQRASMNAASLAAANRYESVLRSVSSQLRESYSAYRTAYDLARHYRDEIVPLRKTMAEENVLRYNGMLIGVFELLADTRDQITSVMAAINAQQQFWLADAGLSSSVIGRPMSMGASPMSSSTTGGSEGQGH